MEKHPEHIEDKTFLMWMHYRNEKDPNWCLRGLTYVITDSTGRYQDLQLTKAFEIFFQNDRGIVLHHPNYTEKQIQPHVKKQIMNEYSDLNLEY